MCYQQSVVMQEEIEARVRRCREEKDAAQAAEKEVLLQVQQATKVSRDLGALADKAMARADKADTACAAAEQAAAAVQEAMDLNVELEKAITQHVTSVSGNSAAKASIPSGPLHCISLPTSHNATCINTIHLGMHDKL